MESKARKKYLEKQIHPLGVFERLNTSNPDNPSFVHPIAICIPIYNEFPHFFKTLRSIYFSLAQSLSYLQKDFVPISIICSVNAKENEDFEIQDNNEKLLRELMRLQKTEFFENELMNIHVLNFSQNGFYFGSKDGVGLARKLALDYALQAGSKILVSLDADCLVSRNYIQSLELFYHRHTQANKKAWALTGFSHLIGENVKLEHQNAMKEYERYLFTHSQFLFDIGSPYYPVALGPTIIATSEAYVQCGGMNTKIAGEDFYFLQSLIKLDLKKSIESYVFLASKVFPSDRLSNRVLFGTGTALEEIMKGEKKGFTKSNYKAVEVFFLQFNTLVEVFYAKKNEKKQDLKILKAFEIQVKKASPLVWQFLEEDRFWKDWEKIIKTHWKKKENLIKAFFERFDGLKTIRLFNYLDCQNTNLKIRP